MKNEKGLIVVIEGPSGVGKDSIVAGLKSKYPNTFVKAPSTTSRQMREHESEGNPYYFVSEEEFKKMLKEGEFFEHTMRHGTYRGMSKKHFNKIINQGLFPVKDCDKIGLEALRREYGFDRVFGIFVTCPKEMIIERLKARGDSGEDLQKRINNYEELMKDHIHYNDHVENIVLSDTIKQVYEKIMNYYKNMK